MNNAHIVLIQGNSLYNKQRTICGRLQQILEQRGFQVTILDRMEYKEEHLFIGRLEELKPDAVFTMDMTGFECQTVGDEVSYNGIPCRMMHFLSRAPWEYDILNRRYNFTMFFYCTSSDDQQLIKKHYDRIINIGYIGSEICDSSQKKAFEDRSIEVYLPCTYLPSQKLYQQIEVLPEVFQKIAKYCIGEMERQPKLLFESALADCLQKIQFTCESEEFIEIMQALKCVPQYVKMHYLEKLIEELSARQIKVSVSGQGWADYSTKNQDYFHIMGHNGVSYETCEEIMRDAKAVISYDRSNRILVDEMVENIESCLKNGSWEQEGKYNCLRGMRYNLEAITEHALNDMELIPRA